MQESSGNSPLLALEGFGATFGNRLILGDIELKLGDSGIDVLMGPVKAGKSTLLRALSGLNDNNPNFRAWGKAWLAGRPLGAGHRPALVQQHVAIIQASLRDALLHRLRANSQRSIQEWNEQASQALATFGLSELLPKLNQPLIEQPLEHQRAITILAHALECPTLLMVDEPTYGLPDEASRWLIQWLKALGDKQRLLVVLHHQKQARTLADRIILLGGGRILAHQDAEHFFTHPDNDWVAQFVRSGSIAVPSPDARPEDLDPDAPRLPPLSDEARRILAEIQAACRLEPAPAPTRPPAAKAAPLASPLVPPPWSEPVGTPAAPVRRLAVPPPLSPKGVSTAALVGTAAPADSRGPSGFHWIVPGRLAGCAEPGLTTPIDYDLDLLVRIGVTHLITLTEKDLDQAALARHGLKNIHLPVFDRETPSIAQSYMLLRRMQRLLDESQVIAVHCKAGIGRTGTILAAWLIREGGLNAGSAIARLRGINKAYVQTEAQEKFLHDFEADMLMRL